MMPFPLRLIVAVAILTAPHQFLRAQAIRNSSSTTIPIGIRFVASEANAPPGTCGCFWLKGAALDAAVPVLPHLSAQIEVAGVTVSRVPASTRGLSEITLLAGPRYTLPLHRFDVSAHALFGAVRGFDSDFVVGANRQDTSTNFAMALGGAAEVPLTHSLALRALQVDYLQTDLPNGTDNRQRDIRIGAGIVLHIRLPSTR
jgi:hypothetical protein